MTPKPWQPQVLQDQLTEMGPSESDLNSTKYAYLEFRNSGRVHNVTVMSDLVSKLKQSLSKEGATFHLIHGENVRTGDAASMAIAVGDADGNTYAIDMKRRGADVTVARLKKAAATGRVLQYVGLFMGLIGVLLILAIVGAPMVVLGILAWRNGKKMAVGCRAQVGLLEQQIAMVASISGARLL